MKLKYYLRGLGTGLLVATLLLWIAYSVKESDSALKETLGENYSTTENSSEKESTTQKESDSTEVTTENQSDERISETESDSEKETTEEKTEEETTEEETTKIEVTTVLEEGATVILDIYSGMSSNQVARQLEKLGIVEDNVEFNDYIESKNLQNSIAVGRYEISQSDSYDEIIDKITRK